PVLRPRFKNLVQAKAAAGGHGGGSPMPPATRRTSSSRRAARSSAPVPHTPTSSGGNGVAPVAQEEQQQQQHLPESASDCGSERFLICINPRIVARSAQEQEGIEGCLSVPGMSVIVPRAVRLDVEYTLPSGTIVREQWSHLPAIVFQHELDHLDGRLLIDRQPRAYAKGIPEDVMERVSNRWVTGMSTFYGPPGASSSQSAACTGLA
ncbi:hypothetical protein EON67_01770, partial [archaeon]